MFYHPLVYIKAISSISFYVAPLMLPILLFAPSNEKFYAIPLAIAPCIIAFLITIITNRKLSKEHLSKTKKAREEQEKREELGKWR